MEDNKIKYFLSIEANPGRFTTHYLSMHPNYTGINPLTLEGIDSITTSTNHHDLAEWLIDLGVITEETSITKDFVITKEKPKPKDFIVAEDKSKHIEQISTKYKVCFEHQKDYLNPNYILAFIKANIRNLEMLNNIDNYMAYAIDGCALSVRQAVHELSKSDTEVTEGLIEQLKLIMYMNYEEYRLLGMYIVTEIVPTFENIIIPKLEDIEKKEVPTPIEETPIRVHTKEPFSEIDTVVAINIDLLTKYVEALRLKRTKK